MPFTRLLSFTIYFCFSTLWLTTECQPDLIIGKPPTFSGKDITPALFGSQNADVFPVAYADFNSDKITDIFSLSRDQSRLFIYFGHEGPSSSPLFKPAIQCDLQENWEMLGFAGQNTPVKIVGVVAADFTGDGILDVMLTYKRIEHGKGVEVVIFRGNLTNLTCDVIVEKEDVILNLVQEPLILDVNGDMVMDLVGEVWEGDNDHSKNDNESEDSGKEQGIVKKLWIFKQVFSEYRSPIKPPEPINFIIDPTPIVGLDNDSSVQSHDHDHSNKHCMNPHANAFADIDGDMVPELILITQSHDTNGVTLYHRETYRVNNSEDPQIPLSFHLLREPILIGSKTFHPNVLGQSLFLDLNQDGTLVHLMPFCTNKDCHGENGIIVLAETENGTSKLHINFGDTLGEWSYLCDQSNHHGPTNHIYSNYTTRTIVLRAGDFNLDGFPDLIGLLRPPGTTGGDMNGRAVLFENIPCVSTPEVTCPYPRTFKINFDGLSHYHNVTLATFFDIHEDGLVDVILVRRTNEGSTKPYSDTYGVFGFENSPDYDANFMKVMVLSGLPCPLCPESQTPYGNILSGPVIKYMTVTQSDVYHTAVASQLYRSSHMAMDIPYTIFGIGQSPNFIETLEISVSSNSNNLRIQQWTQIIPNSQIIIIPTPLDEPWLWNAKLFLTPSRAVLNTGLVLIGFCTVICLIVGALQYKERKDDLKERLEEANRFHMM